MHDGVELNTLGSRPAQEGHIRGEDRDAHIVGSAEDLDVVRANPTVTCSAAALALGLSATTWT